MVSAIDICNRALQRIGSPPITAFTDPNVRAQQCSIAYDMCRREEQARAVWRFCVRRCLLTPVDTTTMNVVFGAWASGTTYQAFRVVTYNGYAYISMAAANVGHQPDTSPGFWQLYTGTVVADPFDTTGGTSYFTGQIVYDALNSNNVYISLVSANVDALNVSASWLQLTDATVTTLYIVYPANAGPSSLSGTRNIFILPANYLREAPQDPKAGANSFLGAPGGLMYKDWLYENNYFSTFDPGPILYRFAADVPDTTQFHTLFVNGLSARIGMEICEPITQSESKLKNVTGMYVKFMGEARQVNAIEKGTEEPAEDDFITTRL